MSDLILEGLGSRGLPPPPQNPGTSLPATGSGGVPDLLSVTIQTFDAFREVLESVQEKQEDPYDNLKSANELLTVETLDRELAKYFSENRLTKIIKEAVKQYSKDSTAGSSNAAAGQQAEDIRRFNRSGHILNDDGTPDYLSYKQFKATQSKPAGQSGVQSTVQNIYDLFTDPSKFINRMWDNLWSGFSKRKSDKAEYENYVDKLNRDWAKRTSSEEREGYEIKRGKPLKKKEPKGKKKGSSTSAAVEEILEENLDPETAEIIEGELQDIPGYGEESSGTSTFTADDDSNIIDDVEFTVVDVDVDRAALPPPESDIYVNQAALPPPESGTSVESVTPPPESNVDAAEEAREETAYEADQALIETFNDPESSEFVDYLDQGFGKLMEGTGTFLSGKGAQIGFAGLGIGAAGAGVAAVFNSEGFNNLLDAGVHFFDTFDSRFGPALESISRNVATIFGDVTKLVSTAMPGLEAAVNAVSNTLETVSDGWNKFLDDPKGTIIAAVQAAGEVTNETIDVVKGTVVHAVGEENVKYIKQQAKDAYEGGKELVSGIKDIAVATEQNKVAKVNAETAEYNLRESLARAKISDVESRGVLAVREWNASGDSGKSSKGSVINNYYNTSNNFSEYSPYSEFDMAGI